MLSSNVLGCVMTSCLMLYASVRTKLQLLFDRYCSDSLVENIRTHLLLYTNLCYTVVSHLFLNPRTAVLKSDHVTWREHHTYIADGLLQLLQGVGLRIHIGVGSLTWSLGNH